MPSYSSSMARLAKPEKPEWERSTILPFSHRTLPPQPVMAMDESGRPQLFTPPSHRWDVPQAVADVIDAGRDLYGHLSDVASGKIQTYQLPEIAPYVNKDVAELGLFGVAPEGSMAAGGGIKTLGKAMDLFHGSPVSGLTRLKPGQRGPFGPAVYSSPLRQVGERYAGGSGKIYEHNIDPGEIFHGLGSTYLEPDINPYDVWRSQRDKLAAVAGDKAEAIRNALDKLHPSDGYTAYWEIRRAMGSDQAAQDLLKRAGFKGMSGHVDGPEVALFDDVSRIVEIMRRFAIPMTAAGAAMAQQILSSGKAEAATPYATRMGALAEPPQ